MARNTDPSCKQCRREGEKLFLKGPRCESDKCAMERRPYPPGEHGRGRVKETEYLLQLREKQKAKRIYGVLERQFRRYYGKASRQQGITGETCSPPGDQAGQRDLPHGVRRLPRAGEAASLPWPFPGQRPSH